jgi:hypothetical protein
MEGVHVSINGESRGDRRCNSAESLRRGQDERLKSVLSRVLNEILGYLGEVLSCRGGWIVGGDRRTEIRSSVNE